MKRYIIAIDGPSAAGKSFLSKELSDRLKIVYIDTGAMYRAVAYYMLKNNIDYTDEQLVSKELENIFIGFKRIDNILHIFLNNEDISENIRTEKIGMIASKVSAYKEVRKQMVDQQRKMADVGSVVLDGRDIGSVVFPNADLKIYLTASEDERANRRLLDLKKKGDGEVLFENVLDDIKQRDYNDINKPISPLIKTEDAVEIDTTNISKDEVVNKVIALLNERDVI